MSRAEHPAGRALPGGTPDPYAASVNPYDLATWSRAAAAARAAGTSDTGTPDENTEWAPRPPDAVTEPGAREDDEQEIAYDPPDVVLDGDTHELARRTVNRSRAAARDRGLFPISAKTQARDARDRSSRAPGYSGARPDPRDPQGIDAIMRRVLGDLGWTEGVNAGRVLEEWEAIVGEQVANHCHPVSLDEGVLVISADSSAWAAQMRMLTPRLISTIEEHVGAHVISELRVTGPAAAQKTWKKGRRTVTWRGPRDTYG